MYCLKTLYACGASILRSRDLPIITQNGTSFDENAISRDTVQF
jgi:hypothetical protein